jgi:P27 family predicted phage terminase small subunit
MNNRKPTKIKRAQGNPGKRPLPQHEPQPTRDVALTPPPHLNAVAVEEWNRLVGEMDALGVYTSWDRGTMAAYCQAYSEWVTACRRVKREGSIVTTKNGMKQPNPAQSQLRQARDSLVKYGGLLGLNPSDRTRIAAKPKQPDGLDAGADFGEGAM